jgi:hypothetical protein
MFCGCFEFDALKVGLAPQRMGDLLILLGPQFQITKNLKLVDLTQRAKKICRCFEFEALKVDLAPQHMGDLLIPLGPQFQITKHLKLGFLIQRAKFFCGYFEFEALKVDLASQRRGGLLNSTKAPISNHQTSKISRFGSKSQIFLWVF